jgi:hypothetical protein
MAAATVHPPLIRALLEPGAYPHPVGDISLVETHISWVLLTGQFAYKVKKPVDLGFLDFSSLELRRTPGESAHGPRPVPRRGADQRGRGRIQGRR